MSITIRKYNKADFDNWENFVNKSTNGTIFHLRTFLSYHIDRTFNDNSLIFEKKGKITILFLPSDYCREWPKNCKTI